MPPDIDCFTAHSFWWKYVAAATVFAVSSEVGVLGHGSLGTHIIRSHDNVGQLILCLIVIALGRSWMVLRVRHVVIVEHFWLLLGCGGILRYAVVNVLRDHEHRFAVHHWLFITLIRVTGGLAVVAIQDGLVHGQARN